MTPEPSLAALVERVRDARSRRVGLDIRGGDTKRFLGGLPQGESLDVSGHAGIVAHEPTELVVTARGGTPLVELETALADHGQRLAFEPPRYRIGGAAGATGGHGAGQRAAGAGGTVGGMVAAGLAGPSRATAGGVRDHVLGVVLLDGRGELLRFGGTVIKNVAGYDVSRLVAGSMGVLGVIAEVSLKVLPVPAATATLRFELGEAAALARLADWGGMPLPLSASAWWDGMLVLRLAGAAAAVAAAVATLGGEVVEPALAAAFWDGLRDHTDEFFAGARKAVDAGAVLWRLSLPQTAPPLRLSGEQLVEWGGAQRWLCTTAAPQTVRDAAQAAGGHATAFHGGDRGGAVFARPKPPADRIQQRLKAAFDPDRVFNRGRLQEDL